MSAAQITRLKQIGDQMTVELITADLFDHETLQALKAIVIPIAEALNLDTAPRDPGPLVLDAVMCHDQRNDAWWGLCATCGIVTVIWQEYQIAKASLTRHMERAHPSFEYALKEMEATS